jgi:Fungal specific transcription factor domain
MSLHSATRSGIVSAWHEALRQWQADQVLATSPTPTDTSTGSAVAADDLPLFATLTTDEDRERKAECSSPGTYNVIVNPDSFQHLPEYSDDAESKSLGLSPLRRGSLAASMASSHGKEALLVDGVPPGSIGSGEDPNVVILHRFEDTARRTTILSREPRSPTPLRQSSSSPEQADTETQFTPDPTTSLIFKAANGGEDFGLLQQFRNVVWKQLTQIEAEKLDATQHEHITANVFEHAAAYFPPLFHAMMAVAALSLAHQEGTERLDALQHYQQALPALQSNLRSAQDLSSDGAFLTHFLLLVYEIAAAEAEGSNLWAQHLAQLLRISLLRREVFGGERFPFITWWIFNIDLHALYSGAGTGDFVGTMLNNDMIPPPSFHLYPLGMDGSSIMYVEETDTLPIVLQLNYEVTVLAVRLGLLAKELKQEASQERHGFSLHEQHVDIRMRQSRILELQESLRQLWVAPNIMLLGQRLDLLPRRSQQLFQQASSLYRACIIFSHTSMWPSQRLDTGPEFDTEIGQCVAEILHTAEGVVTSGRLELRFIIFPLFMAGFASADGGQKMTALDMISTMEKKSIGSNTTATRHALQIVYEQQTQRFMHTGHSLDVNWSDIMVEQGLQVVNFGL